MIKVKIADLVIEMDYSETFIYKAYFDFICDISEPTDIYWYFRDGEIPNPGDTINSQKMNDTFAILRDKSKIYAMYDDDGMYIINTIVYEDNYKKATIYIHKKVRNQDSIFIEKLVKSLFLFQREAFFFAIQNYGGISIHSSSIIYREAGIVFSAMSGTGKSTHTNLWNKYYKTPILDGDVTVCRILDGKPYIYGLPWSGTSGLYVNARKELKVVVFLKQSKINKVNELSEAEIIKRLFLRSFTSRWFEDIVKNEIEFTKRIIEAGVKGYNLECNISREAVDLIKTEIDKQIAFSDNSSLNKL